MIGKEAGYVQPDGYLGVRIGGKHYPIHKLIWLIETGSYPTKMIDHINGDKKDNRISNLREVDNRRNQQNQKRHRLGHLVGATYIKRSGLWLAQIQHGGKHHFLGYFDTELEAHQRYVQELKVKGLSLPKAEMQEINDMIKQDLGEV